MAILNPLNPDQDEDQQQPGNNAPPTITSGQSSTVSGVGHQAPGANPQQQTSSGRFVNLQKYINANQNYNKDGGGLSGKVKVSLEDRGHGVQNTIGQAGTTFQGQANTDHNKWQLDQGLVDTALATPDKFLQNQQDKVGKWHAMRQAQYGGPMTLDDLQGDHNLRELQADNNQFQQVAGMTDTDKGRFGLLREMFGKPTYTTGQQRFDNLMIQRRPDQLNPLLEASKNLRTETQKVLTDTDNTTREKGSQLKTEADDTKTKVTGALTDTTNRNMGAVQTKLQKAQSDLQSRMATIRGQLSGGGIQADLARPMGIDTAEIYNVDPSSYFRATGAAPTMARVATAQDYSTMRALATLAALDPDQTYTDFRDVSQAATWRPEEGYMFDKGGFQGAIDGARNAYNSQYSSAINEKERLYNLMGHHRGRLDGSRGQWLVNSLRAGESLHSEDRAAAQAMIDYENAENTRRNVMSQFGVDPSGNVRRLNINY